MEKLQEWWDSKKTKHMLLGKALILGIVLACLWTSGGDVEKFTKFIGAVKEAIIGIAVLTGITVGAQGMADNGKEKAKIEAKANALSTTIVNVTAGRNANARKTKKKKRTKKKK